ncbi:MAG TPA: hypothetical protein ENJ82_09805 [Bacteroidetes bacterium]|nr:hypothetical protein [Bacteroidota bacterium]
MEIRRLIRNAFLFSLGFLILSAALQWLYEKKVIDHAREANLAAALLAHTEIDYLFLGDSHPMKAVDTALVPGSFLFASTGENYTFNRLRLQHVLEAGIHPKAVVIPLDLHCFGRARRAYIADDAYWVRQPAYLALGEEKGQYYSYLRRYVRAHTLAYAGQFRRIAYAMYPALPKYLELTGGKWALLDSNGIGFMARALAEDGRETADLHFGDGQTYPDAELEAEFQRLLKLCKAQDIAVRLVRYPVTAPYLSRAAELIGPEFIQPLETFVFGGDSIPVFDAMQRYVDQPAYFLDAHHLNPSGRATFSKALQIWLQKR